ncbi:MAG: lipid-A-disaccharide synthase [Pseudomonadota bacterium]
MATLNLAVVAGETSGDLLGASVLSALRGHYGDLTIRGVGGEALQRHGLSSEFPIERLSVMGLVDPLKRLPELLRCRHRLCRQLLADPPDIFLGIDAPEFNLPLARRLRRAGVTTVHLVSPSVWAWRQGRLPGIRRAVDLVLCLFPFELPIYQRSGIPVRFVGHPLADEIDPQPDRIAARRALGLPDIGPLLAVLPGSRQTEVRHHAAVFLAAAERLCQHEPRLGIVVPLANEACREAFATPLGGYSHLPVTLVAGRSRTVMEAADAVLTVAGTASLEAALMRRPVVVAYRTDKLTWWVLSSLVRTEYVALPNLLLGRGLVPEVLQQHMTPDQLANSLAPWLFGGGAAAVLDAGFTEIREQLAVGFAQRAAASLMELLEPGA